MTATTMTRSEWLQERRLGIGGSDAAAILGMSPFSSPFQVWLTKTGEWEDEQSEAMEWGQRLEEPIAQAYTEKTGRRLLPAPDLLVSVEQPFMVASLDRYVAGPDGTPVAVWEGKTASPFDDRWDFYSLEVVVPDYIRLQCQHYLAVTGMDRCYGATLVGGAAFHTWEVARDDRLIDDLITAEQAWWEKYVVSNTPPPADGHDATTEAIRSMFPESVDGSEIDLPAEASKLLADWCSAKEAKKRAEFFEDEAANQLRLLLGDAESGRIDGARAVTWKSHIQRRIDTERLRTEHPEVAAAVTTESIVRPLRLARGFKPNV